MKIASYILSYEINLCILASSDTGNFKLYNVQQKCFKMLLER